MADLAPLEKEKILFKEFEHLDAALGWAEHLGKSGSVPLLIEGDDGTRLDKREIAAALAPGASAPTGRDHQV